MPVFTSIHKLLTNLLLCVGLATAGSAQISKTPKGYLLRVKYVPGTTIKYDTLSSIVNKGGNAPSGILKIPMTYKVVSLEKGKATVKLTIEAGTIAPSKSPVSQPQTIVMHLDDRNRPDNGQGIPGIGAFPSNPMKPGATWSSVVPVKALGSLIKLEGVYRFVGIKQVESRSYAVVTYDLKGSANGNGTMLLSKSDGSIYSNQMNISVTGPDAVLLVHIVMKRRP